VPDDETTECAAAAGDEYLVTLVVHAVPLPAVKGMNRRPSRFVTAAGR
jgi:hypothetical protein